MSPDVTPVVFISSFSSADVISAPSLVSVTYVAAVFSAHTVLITSGGPLSWARGDVAREGDSVAQGGSLLETKQKTFLL